MSLIDSIECIMKSCLSVCRLFICAQLHFKSSNTWQIKIKYKIKIMLQKVTSNLYSWYLTICNNNVVGVALYDNGECDYAGEQAHFME